VRSWLQEFKQFIMRGNVLDLAVAVVIGAAFKAIVDSLVNDVIQPIIGAAFGKPNFSHFTVHVGHGVVRYGSFATQILNFLIIAGALFVVIKTFERLQTLRLLPLGHDSDEPPLPPEPTEIELLTQIRDAVRAQQ